MTVHLQCKIIVIVNFHVGVVKFSENISAPLLYPPNFATGSGIVLLVGWGGGRGGNYHSVHASDWSVWRNASCNFYPGDGTFRNSVSLQTGGTCHTRPKRTSVNISHCKTNSEIISGLHEWCWLICVMIALPSDTILELLRQMWERNSW